MHNAKSYILVFLQFSLLGALIIYAGIFGSLSATIIAFIGISLGIWAMAAMRFSVSILPTVRDHQELIVAGPYKYIMHPMYTAVLLIALAAVINKPLLLSGALWLSLYVVLTIKLQYEEQQLTKKFTTYKDYANRTKRLVPFVY